MQPYIITHSFMSSYHPTVFNQIFRLMRDHFSPFLGQLNRYAKVMNCTSLAKILLYAQITGKESLRDVETGLQCNSNKLYHLGIRSTARSTIAYRNNKTDSSLYEHLFYTLLQQYRTTCIGVHDDLGIPTIALDSTLISLALGAYDRATYRTTK